MGRRGGPGTRFPVASRRPSPPRSMGDDEVGSGRRLYHRWAWPCPPVPARSPASPRDTREACATPSRAPNAGRRFRRSAERPPRARIACAVSCCSIPPTWARWGPWVRARSRTRVTPRRGPERACAPCSRLYDAHARPRIRSSSHRTSPSRPDADAPVLVKLENARCCLKSAARLMNLNPT